MATRTTVIMTCDLDHEVETDADPDTSPVVFSLDGYTYELDLCGPHAEEVRATFRNVTAYARKPSRSAGIMSRGPMSRRESRRESRAARDWLREHPEVIDGQSVSERGRLAEAHLAVWRAKGRPGLSRG